MNLRYDNTNKTTTSSSYFIPDTSYSSQQTRMHDTFENKTNNHNPLYSNVSKSRLSSTTNNIFDVNDVNQLRSYLSPTIASTSLAYTTAYPQQNMFDNSNHDLNQAFNISNDYDVNMLPKYSGHITTPDQFNNNNNNRDSSSSWRKGPINPSISPSASQMLANPLKPTHIYDPIIDVINAMSSDETSASFIPYHIEEVIQSRLQYDHEKVLEQLLNKINNDRLQYLKEINIQNALLSHLHNDSNIANNSSISNQPQFEQNISMSSLNDNNNANYKSPNRQHINNYSKAQTMPNTGNNNSSYPAHLLSPLSLRSIPSQTAISINSPNKSVLPDRSYKEINIDNNYNSSDSGSDDHISKSLLSNKNATTDIINTITSQNNNSNNKSYINTSMTSDSSNSTTAANMSQDQLSRIVNVSIMDQSMNTSTMNQQQYSSKNKTTENLLAALGTLDPMSLAVTPPMTPQSQQSSGPQTYPLSSSLKDSAYIANTSMNNSNKSKSDILIEKYMNKYQDNTAQQFVETLDTANASIFPTYRDTNNYASKPGLPPKVPVNDRSNIQKSYVNTAKTEPLPVPPTLSRRTSFSLSQKSNNSTTLSDSDDDYKSNDKIKFNFITSSSKSSNKSILSNRSENTNYTGYSVKSMSEKSKDISKNNQMIDGSMKNSSSNSGKSFKSSKIYLIDKSEAQKYQQLIDTELSPHIQQLESSLNSEKSHYENLNSKYNALSIKYNELLHDYNELHNTNGKLIQENSHYKDTTETLKVKLNMLSETSNLVTNIQSQLYNDENYTTLNPSLKPYNPYSNSSHAPHSPIPLPSLQPPTPTPATAYHSSYTSSSSVPLPLSFDSIDTFSKKVEETLYLEQSEILNKLKSQNQLIETQKHVRQLLPLNTDHILHPLLSVDINSNINSNSNSLRNSNANSPYRYQNNYVNESVNPHINQSYAIPNNMQQSLISDEMYKEVCNKSIYWQEQFNETKTKNSSLVEKLNEACQHIDCLRRVVMKQQAKSNATTPTTTPRSSKSPSRRDSFSATNTTPHQSDATVTQTTPSSKNDNTQERKNTPISSSSKNQNTFSASSSSSQSSSSSTKLISTKPIQEYQVEINQLNKTIQTLKAKLEQTEKDAISAQNKDANIIENMNSKLTLLMGQYEKYIQSKEKSANSSSKSNNFVEQPIAPDIYDSQSTNEFHSSSTTAAAASVTNNTSSSHKKSDYAGEGGIGGFLRGQYSPSSSSHSNKNSSTPYKGSATSTPRSNSNSNSKTSTPKNSSKTTVTPPTASTSSSNTVTSRESMKKSIKFSTDTKFQDSTSIVDDNSDDNQTADFSEQQINNSNNNQNQIEILEKQMKSEYDTKINHINEQIQNTLNHYEKQNFCKDKLLLLLKDMNLFPSSIIEQFQSFFESNFKPNVDSENQDSSSSDMNIYEKLMKSLLSNNEINRSSSNHIDGFLSLTEEELETLKKEIQSHLLHVYHTMWNQQQQSDNNNIQINSNSDASVINSTATVNKAIDDDKIQLELLLLQEKSEHTKTIQECLELKVKYEEAMSLSRSYQFEIQELKIKHQNEIQTILSEKLILQQHETSISDDANNDSESIYENQDFRQVVKSENIDNSETFRLLVEANKNNNVSIEDLYKYMYNPIHSLYEDSIEESENDEEDEDDDEGNTDQIFINLSQNTEKNIRNALSKFPSPSKSSVKSSASSLKTILENETNQEGSPKDAVNRTMTITSNDSDDNDNDSGNDDNKKIDKNNYNDNIDITNNDKKNIESVTSIVYRSTADMTTNAQDTHSHTHNTAIIHSPVLQSPVRRKR